MKATRQQKKIIKEMMRHLEECCGTHMTGLLLSLLCDGLDQLAGDTGRNIRSIEIKFNNFYSIKHDLITRKTEFVGM